MRQIRTADELHRFLSDLMNADLSANGVGFSNRIKNEATHLRANNPFRRIEQLETDVSVLERDNEKLRKMLEKEREKPKKSESLSQ